MSDDDAKVAEMKIDADAKEEQLLHKHGISSCDGAECYLYIASALRAKRGR